MDPIPDHRIVPASQAVGVASFADWYAACLYDPAWGYYASGRVEFGPGGDFSTYPQRLSPVFGWMLCDVFEHLLAPIAARAPADLPLTILEFGAGDGDLADDILNRFLATNTSLAPRLSYRIVETSPQLRERQQARLRHHLDTGRLEIVDGAHCRALGRTVRFHFSDGHTPGLMLAEIIGPEQEHGEPHGGVVFCADLIPGRPWVHVPITMGYDRNAELLIDEKREFLADKLARDVHLYFTHDPGCALAKVTRDERGRYGTANEVPSLQARALPA